MENVSDAELDTDDTDFPVCPSCGTIDYDWWDGLGIEVNDGTEWSRSCDECGAEFKVTACVNITFTTTKEQQVKGA